MQKSTGVAKRLVCRRSPLGACPRRLSLIQKSTRRPKNTKFRCSRRESGTAAGPPAPLFLEQIPQCRTLGSSRRRPMIESRVSDASLPEPDLALELLGIEKNFGGVKALRGANLSVRRGEIMGL